MDLVLRVLYFVLGSLVVSAVLLDLFSQVVVPRPSRRRWRISRLFYRASWRLWRWFALRQDPETREDMLGGYAPFSVIALLVICVGVVLMSRWAPPSMEPIDADLITIMRYGRRPTAPATD